MQEGLCRDEEGSSAHPKQGDELQKPKPDKKTKQKSQNFKNCTVVMHILAEKLQ